MAKRIYIKENKAEALTRLGITPEKTNKPKYVKQNGIPGKLVNGVFKAFTPVTEATA